MTAQARRVDLLVEVDATLDGSGNFVGDWIDTAEVLRIRVLTTVGSNAVIEESADQTNVFGTGVPGGTPEIPLTMRYFRLTVVGGTPSAHFRGTVRAIA